MYIYINKYDDASIFIISIHMYIFTVYSHLEHPTKHLYYKRITILINPAENLHVQCQSHLPNIFYAQNSRDPK